MHFLLDKHRYSAAWKKRTTYYRVVRYVRFVELFSKRVLTSKKRSVILYNIIQIFMFLAQKEVKRSGRKKVPVCKRNHL